jgi:hypothetical protein
VIGADRRQRYFGHSKGAIFRLTGCQADRAQRLDWYLTHYRVTRRKAVAS